MLISIGVQYGGDEVVKAKDGAGSATLSMAYAGFRLVMWRSLSSQPHPDIGNSASPRRSSRPKRARRASSKQLLSIFRVFLEVKQSLRKPVPITFLYLLSLEYFDLSTTSGWLSY